MSVLAVDIGGTKIDVGIVSYNGDVLARSTKPTLTTNDGEELFAFLMALISEVQKEFAAQKINDPVVACGVGCGGPMTVTTVSPLNIGAWREFPLAARLTDELQLQVVVDNDAKALASGEGRWGAAQGLRNYMAIVVSTGIGGGLVIDGNLVHGQSGNAGHVGHVIVEPDGQLCRCGARGCVEAEVSGTALEKILGYPAKDAPQEWRERTGTLVGRAVADVANLCDISAVLVAGSVAFGFGDDFLLAAQKELSQRAQLSFSKTCTIAFCGLGPKSPLLGAASLGFSLVEK